MTYWRSNSMVHRCHGMHSLVHIVHRCYSMVHRCHSMHSMVCWSMM